VPCPEPSTPVYGEFVFTLPFGQLPIVPPGASLVFPTATVEPVGVRYVQDETQVGLLVPRGVYLVAWTLNPSEGASVNLLVNGQSPVTAGSPLFPYTQSITTTVLAVQYLVNAPLPQDNLISLVNGGSSLFVLNDIPNTRIGTTSLVTQIRVQRIDKDVH